MFPPKISWLVLLAVLPGVAHAEHAEYSIRPGFTEQVIADSLDSPVSMAIAPDGRIFVCEQGGRLRVIKRGVLLVKPFVTVPTAAEVEEGLLGVAFDPQFTRNHAVYVCYTAIAPTRHNRIVRFIASGDTALPNAQTIFELDDHLAHMHVGGALRFGPDGTLYVGTGENGEGGFSQSLRSTSGKLLRIRADGSIPEDNPFFTIASGSRRAIWARGLRNAFAFDIQPRTGRIFINDVGGSAFEEIDEGVAGANYGWPVFEGPGNQEGFRDPIHSYDHTSGCAITGGAFYDPPVVRFPREWVGRYFYAEYCGNEIRWIDPAAPARAQTFGKTAVQGPLDLRVGPDGALYYLAHGNSNPVGGDHTSSGSVVRIAAMRGGGR